jgi:hypothetical protein
MSSNTRTITAAYHLAQLMETLTSLDQRDLSDLTKLASLAKSDRSTVQKLQALALGEAVARQDRREDLSFKQFKFDFIMTKLRNAIMHSNQVEDLAEADWLIKLMLMSPKVFPRVKELETFLANMTGVQHGTKSTGRDRIVDWYVKHIANLSVEDRNKTYHRIARHLFINFSSGYKQWRELLSSSGGR